MTTSIGGFNQAHNDTNVEGRSASAVPPASSQANTVAASAGGEAVTVSSDATFSTDLLNAARSSDGIDHAAVARLSTAMQNGSYNVSPEDLAGAMINAAKTGS